MEPHKNLIVFLIFTTLSLTSILPAIAQVSSTQPSSEVVSADEAIRVAMTQLHNSEKTEYSVKTCQPVSPAGECLFYAIDLEPTGYIVVPASRYLPPVMAYSWTSPFGTYTADNPLYSMLIADITQRLDNARKLPASMLNQEAAKWDAFLTNPSSSRCFQQWPPEGSTPTDGWVLTLWTQNAPYNNLCPYINSARSLAGCPAVAMAQILAYFNTTKNVSFTDADDYHHNYGGANFYIDDDYVAYQFPSWPQLNSYLTTLESHWATHTALTNQDKAALNVACGFAMHQVYNPSGSGTFGVDQAYQGYQRFGFTTAILFMGESQEMFQHLSQDMKQGIPAHLAIVDAAWQYGHNVVVDGYNTDDFYHVNFGWGGSYNGWYHIPDDFSQAPYNMSVVEGVVVDIMPAENHPPAAPGPIHGPAEGQVGVGYTYSVNQVTDPEGDSVQYLL